LSAANALLGSRAIHDKEDVSVFGRFATRTSCHYFQGNQLRVLLAALGYVLIERLRALTLQGTALTTA
jgi:hypothetical protein